MAGTGPAPAEQRRRRNEPARGEWIDLQPIVNPTLPALPEGDYPTRTRGAWDAWRTDPASAMFGPAEVSAALDLLELHSEWARGKTMLSAEVRLRMDGLGLTAKGKRDLRWRVSVDSADRTPRKARARGGERRTRLSVVQ